MSPGLRNDEHMTSAPSSTRGTTAPSAASVVHASRMPSSGSPTDRNSRWSKTQTRIEPERLGVLGVRERLGERRGASVRGVALGEGERDADAHRASLSARLTSP